MVYTILVQLIALFTLIISGQGVAKTNQALLESYMGEKKFDIFAGTWQPFVQFDEYQGTIEFKENIYREHYLQKRIWPKEQNFEHFFRSELAMGLLCPNEKLSQHWQEIRYAFRLITLSYLLEGQWHMNMLSQHFNQKNGCQFDFDKWLNNCRPRSEEMKKFVALVKKYKPRYVESLAKEYRFDHWVKDYKQNDLKYFSHYRTRDFCEGKCTKVDFEPAFNKICKQDEELMSLICSEEDQLYGLSEHPDAYQLIAVSNIINTFNQAGEAEGCLKRFSMLMNHKEVNYPRLKTLFKTIRTHLFNQYQERFLQGRIYFYGSGKEFEIKKLTDFYVMEQPFKIAELDPEETNLPKPIVHILPKVEEKPKTKNAPVVKSEVKKKEVVELPVKLKSAFLQASEMRESQNLELVEVDMVKFKYDYVFTLNMLNKLSGKMKKFMTREALTEMVSFDQLGTKEGPVPLLFVKYMLDMHEHTGLFNLVTIVGDEFYVTNEIDMDFKTKPEKIKLVNNESTKKQWQIYVVRP